MVVAGEPAEVLETELHGDIRDRADVLWRAKRGVDGAQTAMTQVRDRADPERFVKGAMQGSPGDMKLNADLGDVDSLVRPGIQIFLRPSHDLQRLGERTVAIRRDPCHDVGGDRFDHRPFPVEKAL